ncbi:MAG: hypothetical protein V3T20_05555 [Gemmatimonadota bacterium]
MFSRLTSNFHGSVARLGDDPDEDDDYDEDEWDDGGVSAVVGGVLVLALEPGARTI